MVLTATAVRHLLKEPVLTQAFCLDGLGCENDGRKIAHISSTAHKGESNPGPPLCKSGEETCDEKEGLSHENKFLGTLKNNMPSALSTPVNSVRVGVYEAAWQSQDAKCISCSVNQEEKKSSLHIFGWGKRTNAHRIILECFIQLARMQVHAKNEEVLLHRKPQPPVVNPSDAEEERSWTYPNEDSGVMASARC